MRVLACFSISLMMQVASAAAQTPEQVKSDVLAALSTPLPITVVGPLTARDVTVVPSGDGFQVTLDQTNLMGIAPLGSISLKLTPAGDKLYHVTDLALPKSFDFFNKAKIALGGSSFDGLWSTETRSYSNLAFKLDKIDLAFKGQQDAKVQVGSLAMEVSKQGDSGATDSKFTLQASDVTSKGLPPNNIAVKNLKAELLANGPEPVDLYAVLARFALLAAVNQGGGNAVLQFAESLRAKSYDHVALTLAADGVEAIGSAPGSTERLAINAVAGAADLTKVTPEEWGGLNLVLNGNGIKNTGFADVKEIDADTGMFSITGSQIPIAATLNALSKLEALSKGQDASFKASEIVDGLLNIGALKLSSSADNVVYLPVNKEDASLHIGKYALESGSEGFRDNKGHLFFASSADDVNWEMHKFDSDLQKKAMAVLNPKRFKYDLSVSDINEALLRKLMADVEFDGKDGVVALAAPAATYFMAAKPILESKDMSFQSAGVNLMSSGKIRFYPSLLLSGLAYDGESKVSMQGLDKVLNLLQEMKDAPQPAASSTDTAEPDANSNTDINPPAAPSSDRTSYVVFESLLKTLRALAVIDGDKLTWSLKYPKAGEGLVIVNDTELRYPNLVTTLWPLLVSNPFRH